ncbi:hypothetical protein [uncultured Nevskia sp.]|uniref:hypothetical protein n=1 Tax=uncultured Nevskia sp. TaxID=228950 RepID=UPI0025E52DD3|nr:hypothetical protein [uncultured Nevskia sp.]
MKNNKVRPLLLLFSACLLSAPAFADPCLQTDKKGADGDPRSYDYGKCKSDKPSETYGSIGVIGQQMQGLMEQRQANDDAERAVLQRSNAAFLAERAQLYSKMKYGTAMELVNGQETVVIFQYKDAEIPAEQRAAIRSEIGAAIDAGKLLETYGTVDYSSDAAWPSQPASEKWKACEVATVLTRAYTFGDFVTAEQKNPAKGFAIARTGKERNCGGTAYWLGRIFELGDTVTPGVDKVLDKYPRTRIRDAYEVAIVNGILPAYERAAEMNTHPLPRYKDKKYFEPTEFTRYQYWSEMQGEQYQLAIRQYLKCLDFEPGNLICARGLRDLYSLDKPPFKPNAELAAYYKEYVSKLEQLIAASDTAK